MLFLLSAMATADLLSCFTTLYPSSGAFDMMSCTLEVFDLNDKLSTKLLSSCTKS